MHMMRVCENSLQAVLLRCVVSSLVAVFLFAGCGSSDDSQERELAEAPAAIVPEPFYRFTDEAAGTGVFLELKASAGTEELNVLYAPYRTPAQKAMPLDLFRSRMDYANQIDVNPDGTFPLSLLIDRENLSTDATGIAVSIRRGDSKHFDYFPVENSADAVFFDDLVVSTVFEGESDTESAVEAYAREVVPLPREYRSNLVAIPKNARLAFSITVEEILQARAGVPIRFSIDVVGSDFDERVFEFELTPPAGHVRSSKWSHHNIDLAALSGREGHFVFRTEYATTPAEPETTSAVWGNPRLYSENESPASRPPNIILISLDTLRADHIGAYGYERDTTPNLDAFAAQSVLFEDCIAPSSWTTPSHASLFTGWPPYVHEAGAHAGYRLQRQFTTMAELVRNKGYLTAAFTEGGAVAGHLGFSQGFDQYDNGVPAVRKKPGEAEKTFGNASRWLESYGHLPFFLFVHTYEIHAPYVVNDPQWQKFTAPGDVAPIPRPPNVGVEASEKLRDHYDNGVAYTDDVFGVFMRKLDALKLLENTIIVVFSDHGEEFGEHDGTTHGVSLYEEVLHVPCIVRMPGANPSAARISHPVILSDVFPTVLDLIDIEAYSPVGAVTLKRAIDFPDDTGAVNDRNRIAHLVQTTYPVIALSLQDSRYKYIVGNRFFEPDSPLHAFRRAETPWPVSPLEHEFMDIVSQRLGAFVAPNPSLFYDVPDGATQEYLFDLNSDPDESVNLARDVSMGGVLAEFRGRLRQTILEDAESAMAKGISGAEQALQLTAEEEERLRALGYLNNGSN